MAQEGRRVEVRMGSFACTIEGYDDPISKLREVMALVQQMVSETPALVDLSVDVDNAEVQEALDAQSAPVTVRNDAADEAAPDAGGSETDGDFTLASEAPTGERDDWLAGPEEMDVERAADVGPDDAPTPDAAAMDDIAGAADPFAVDAAAVASPIGQTADEESADAPLRLRKEPSEDSGNDEAPLRLRRTPGEEEEREDAPLRLRRTLSDEPESAEEPLGLRPTPSDESAEEEEPLLLGEPPADVAAADDAPTHLRWTPPDESEDEEEPLRLGETPAGSTEAGEAEAASPEPADQDTTPAGRHLYGLGRFAAGMVARQRTADTDSGAPAETPEAAEDTGSSAEPPETPRPTLVDTDDTVNIFAASPEDDFDATVVTEPEEKPAEPRVSTSITNIFASAPPEDTETAGDEPEESPAERGDAGIFASAPPEEPAVTEPPEEAPAEPRVSAGITNIFGAPPPEESVTVAGEEPTDAPVGTEDAGSGDVSAPAAEEEPETAVNGDSGDTAAEPRVSTGFRNIFASRSKPAAPADDASEANIFAADTPEEAAPADTGKDAPDGDGGAEVINVFGSPSDRAEEEPLRPGDAEEPDTGEEEAPLQLTPEARVDDKAEEPFQPRPHDEGPGPGAISRSGRFGALLDRIQARERGEAPGGAHGEGGAGPVPPAAANVTADELVERSGAENVSELLLASAAWLTLAGGKPQFSRRDVMEVFETLPGDHPKTLEARIKGYGKLVRSGTLVLINDGQFALAQSERDRFESLVT